MLVEKDLKDFVHGVASASSTPGGGSVSALVGSLGGALTSMVGNLTIDRKAYDNVPQEKKTPMEQNFKEISKLIDELINLVNEDATAFDDVMEAFKLPKKTEDDMQKRSEAIQLGYKKALEVPLRCGEKCFEILKLQDVFAKYGNINAITDVGIGTLLAYSGLEGALFNVTINLKSIKDQEYKRIMGEKAENLLINGKASRDELLEIVYKRLNG